MRPPALISVAIGVVASIHPTMFFELPTYVVDKQHKEELENLPNNVTVFVGCLTTTPSFGDF